MIGPFHHVGMGQKTCDRTQQWSLTMMEVSVVFAIFICLLIPKLHLPFYALLDFWLNPDSRLRLWHRALPQAAFVRLLKPHFQNQYTTNLCNVEKLKKISHRW